MEYKKMSDKELAAIMVHYITQVKQLKDSVGDYLKSTRHKKADAVQIKNTYCELKTELRQIEHYLTLNCNRDGSALYMGFFSPIIQEAVAYGFLAPINSSVNQKMYSSVSEAHYKLTKNRSLEQWEELAQ